jgi:hypothetical protein
MPLDKVKSLYPCYWFAKYSSNINQLDIYKCNKCQKTIKTTKLNYNNICLNCNSDDVYIDKIYKLDSNEIYEFDYFGNKTIQFKDLPTHKIEYFGLVNAYKTKGEIYTINLKNGNFILNGTIIEPSIYYQKNNFIISNILQYYGDGGDLIHFKSASSASNDHTLIKSFNIGYKCKIDDLNIQIVLSINTKNFNPSFYTNYNKK